MDDELECVKIGLTDYKTINQVGEKPEQYFVHMLTSALDLRSLRFGRMSTSLKSSLISWSILGIFWA